MLCNLPVVIPGYLALPMLMAQRGVDGLASHTAPCSSGTNELNISAFKTKKSSVSHDFCLWPVSLLPAGYVGVEAAYGWCVCVCVLHNTYVFVGM